MYLPTTDQNTRQARLSLVARKTLKPRQAMISKSFFFAPPEVLKRPMMKFVRDSPTTPDAALAATAAMRK